MMVFRLSAAICGAVMTLAFSSVAMAQSENDAVHFHERCYSRIADTMRLDQGACPPARSMGEHSAKTKSQRPDLLQPVSVSRAQLDRTVLQQDQAMSACRNPI
jgi:hypothetical protein